MTGGENSLSSNTIDLIKFLTLEFFCVQITWACSKLEANPSFGNGLKYKEKEEFNEQKIEEL